MKYAAGFIIALALGLVYLGYLDAGCELNGVMTTQGRTCL